MSGNYRSVRLITMIGAIVSAFMIIDGAILMATNGLSSDATSVFPVLGGSFTKTQSSGVSILILGSIVGLLVFAMWVTLGRRLKRESRLTSSLGTTLRNHHSAVPSSATSKDHNNSSSIHG